MNTLWVSIALCSITVDTERTGMWISADLMHLIDVHHAACQTSQSRQQSVDRAFLHCHGHEDFRQQLPGEPQHLSVFLRQLEILGAIAEPSGELNFSSICLKWILTQGRRFRAAEWDSTSVLQVIQRPPCPCIWSFMLTTILCSLSGIKPEMSAVFKPETLLI